MKVLRARIWSLVGIASVLGLCLYLQSVGTLTAGDQRDDKAAAADENPAKSADGADDAAVDQDAGDDKPDQGAGKAPAKKANKSAGKKSKPKPAPKANASKKGKANSPAAGKSGNGPAATSGGAGVPAGLGLNLGQNGNAGNVDAGNGGVPPGAAGKNMAGDDGLPDQKVVDAVVKVQDEHSDDLMKLKGVVGTSTGMTKDGKVVIKVYTNGADKPVIPKQIKGVDVEEIVSGRFKPLNGFAGSPKYDPRTRQTRPVSIGVSSSPLDESCAPDQNCYSGTLGCRLKAKDGSGVYALSNNHVFANENAYSAGHDIMQPSVGELSVFCACIASDKIGTLFDFKPIEFFGTRNVIDAAIMQTTEELVGNETLPDGYGKPRTFTIKKPRLGMRIQKYGRTTGFTKGVVTGLNVRLVVGYSAGPAVFVDQFEITGVGGIIGDHGDSGSLVVTADRFPIGLLFAGDDITHVAVCNPIQRVLDYFGMEIDGDDSQDFPIPGKIGVAAPELPPDFPR